MFQEVTDVPETKINPPEDFSFPFPPYKIQENFMKELFQALEEKKLGIFESPTGTGKSLSLLCGSLTWLEHHENQRLMDLRSFIDQFDIVAEEKESAASSNWIISQHKLIKKKEQICKAKRELKFLEDLIDKRQKIIQKRKNAKRFTCFADRLSKNSASRHSATSAAGNINEVNVKDKIKSEDNLDDFTFDDFALQNNSDSDISDSEEIEEPEFFQNKIIFASRTHSQLSQFAKELQRTSFANKVTATTLGSRQNLCINSEVTRLKNLSLMNEKCIDLQKGSKGKKSSDTKKIKSCQGCPYFQQHAIEELKTHILSEPLAIEDLVTVAKNEFNACPYYASRKAAKEAQLILLPYNTILHAGTRDGVGIQTDKSVLLLDEAHNIIESISNMYSNEINLTQLKDVLAGLESYIKRYMARFSPSNLLQIKRIQRILKAHIQFLENNKTDKRSLKNLFTIQEFKAELGIDNLDFFDLTKFMQKYRLIFKLKGYMVQQQKHALKLAEVGATTETVNNQSKINAKSKLLLNTNNNSLKKPSTPLPLPLLGKDVMPPTWSSQSVLNFAEFLKSLKTCDAEGRIIVKRDENSYKFLLLNVAPQFQDLVLSTRSIILAGGTMKPYDEITDQLFAGSPNRIASFSCSHVIPQDNLVCVTLSTGPTLYPFDFTFKSRKDPNLIKELSQTISNLINIVPGGVVCFLPSYDYEEFLYNSLKETNALSRINSKKRIFREPKGGNCEAVLEEYTRQIRNSASANNGALLFAVVGGKLSEGINFSDDLGRCVIVVGLPYPNIKSIEIQEKVNHSIATFGKEKGDCLLTNMCSKAVNQSVGRAIRHANDYAAIILIDQRFSKPAQQALLPGWIQERSEVCENFGKAFSTVSKFFSKKKQQQMQMQEK